MEARVVVGMVLRAVVAVACGAVLSVLVAMAWPDQDSTGAGVGIADVCVVGAGVAGDRWARRYADRPR